MATLLTLGDTYRCGDCLIFWPPALHKSVGREKKNLLEIFFKKKPILICCAISGEISQETFIDVFGNLFIHTLLSALCFVPSCVSRTKAAHFLVFRSRKTKVDKGKLQSLLLCWVWGA